MKRLTCLEARARVELGLAAICRMNWTSICMDWSRCVEGGRRDEVDESSRRV